MVCYLYSRLTIRYGNGRKSAATRLCECCADMRKLILLGVTLGG